MRDLELPPLSPYAIKYAGYGIERGKLSVDLAYVVQPDGQLTASNKIVLNQLAFGDKVEELVREPAGQARGRACSPTSTACIDLDLPVSGSINDPEFSLGGVIWKAISEPDRQGRDRAVPPARVGVRRQWRRAVAGRVRARLGNARRDRASESLDKVAKALVDRPALSLTVTGESRLDSERDAWKKERLRQFVRAEKRRQAIAGGADATRRDHGQRRASTRRC